MHHLQIAVLRGGPSEEYQVSMKTGAAVIASLERKGYKVKDITISKQGEWLENGLVKDPDTFLQSVDKVFVALHGAYGEDGQVQKILQRHNIPFTGSRSFSSALAFNKAMTKKALLSYGIQTPEFAELSKDNLDTYKTDTINIQNCFGPEYIIKPINSGSSHGVRIVRAGESLSEAVAASLEQYDQILIEELIRGREATCATLENYRSNQIYVFPVMEIIPERDHQFFDHEAKYNGRTQEICPANFSFSERTKIAEVASFVHETLDLSQYSRSDFMVNKNGVYFLEVNTLPGLTSESLYPKAAASVGLNYDDLIVHLIDSASY